MVEERDFALVGIPFAAGIAAGLAVSDAVSVRAVHSAASLTYSATLALAVILLSGTRRSDPLPRKPGPGIALLFLICGFFCSANSFLCGIFPENRNNLKWASEAMGWLSDLLEGMPFSDPGTSALLKALLTGDRSALPKETVTAFREAGASSWHFQDSTWGSSTCSCPRSPHLLETALPPDCSGTCSTSARLSPTASRQAPVLPL